MADTDEVQPAAEAHGQQGQVEQAITDAMFRLLVDSVRDYAIFMLDPSGHVLTWNAGAERAKRYKAHEIIGKHFSVFYRPEPVRTRYPQYELEVAAREGRYEDEGWRVRKDGTEFWANVVITALRDEKGELVGFAKVTRDLTERRAAEEELIRARQDLERRVEERTGELSRANHVLQAEVERRQRLEDTLRQQAEQLREDATRKDEFLAMLAHELRNPIGAISNALHVMSLTQPGSPAFGRGLEVANRQIAHQSRMVDDLLDVSRITRGKIRLRQELMDLVEAVRDTVEDHRPAFIEAQLGLRTELPQKPLLVRGDRTRLAQIVGNLLDNARKFTEPSGVVTVRISPETGSRKVRLSVRDTGMGIEPEVRPRLFEPFAQADRTLARSRGGLGLGLALVKGLAELHGGSVSVESPGIGLGSEFTVTLPCEAPVARAKNGRKDIPEAGGKLRILVIEDIPDAAETLRDLLEVFGYQVELAYDGPEGLEKARETRPEVVLCDIGLPGMDGYEVAAELRQNPLTSSAHLIAVTGYGSEEDRRRTLSAGFELHLTKPVTLDALKQALSKVDRRS